MLSNIYEQTARAKRHMQKQRTERLSSTKKLRMTVRPCSDSSKHHVLLGSDKNIVAHLGFAYKAMVSFDGSSEAIRECVNLC